MSKIIFTSLIRSTKSVKFGINCSNHQVFFRVLSTRSNDRLLNNFFNSNQTSFRFNSQSNKSDNETSKDAIQSAQSSESSEQTESKNSRFTSSPKANKQQIFSWRTLGISSTIAMIYFGVIYYLKQQKEGEWERERVKSLGKAAIGGSFELVDVNNKPVSNKDFLGKWCLIYFGFSHCPDVCPEEIEKMVKVYENLKARCKKDEVVPLFISVDPERDTPEVVKKYCAEFSPHIIGLTGTVEQVKNVCKNYRVYFSAGPQSKDKDYIVDHTIIIYLINPEGEFVDYYGQTRDAEMITNAVQINMKKYRQLKFGSWF